MPTPDFAQMTGNLRDGNICGLLPSKRQKLSKAVPPSLEGYKVGVTQFRYDAQED